MTKDELITQVSKKAGCSKGEVGEVIEAALDAISSALTSGDSVTLTGFGTFAVSHRNARAGINPQTREKIKIPAMNVPKFKAGKALKDAVR